jgi:SPX domain protein involved in polyphosphate accumulation
MRWFGMPPDHHELKYLVTETKALQLRDYIQAQIDLDERSVGRPNFSYPVHTLYLDSRDLRLYDALVSRHRNSTQLRLRSYDTDPASPVFIEIKRWSGTYITKERAALLPTFVPSLLRGQIPSSDALLSRSPKDAAALENFVRLVEQIDATPLVQISYFREGYADDRGTARINLDRHILAERRTTVEIRPAESHPHRCFEAMVMLELKFSTRFPNWFIPLVERFNLEEFDTSKYIVALQAVGLASP